MPILTPDEFMRAMPTGGRVMALDVGAKTIGLATAVLGLAAVLPLKTLTRVKFTRDAESLRAIMAECDVKGLVIGYPLNRDGSEGKRCQSVRDFTAELDRFLQNVNITFWDERFSTAIGDEMVDNIGKTAGKALNRSRRDDIIDSLAAQQILQDYTSRY